MRVWHVHPRLLNLQRVLGEHRELHAIMGMMHSDHFTNHSIVKRWKSRILALRFRHELLVDELIIRGYRDHATRHKTPFDLTIEETQTNILAQSSVYEIVDDLEDLYKRQPEFLLTELAKASKDWHGLISWVVPQYLHWTGSDYDFLHAAVRSLRRR